MSFSLAFASSSLTLLPPQALVAKASVDQRGDDITEAVSKSDIALKPVLAKAARTVNHRGGYQVGTPSCRAVRAQRMRNRNLPVRGFRNRPATPHPCLTVDRYVLDR